MDEPQTIKYVPPKCQKCGREIMDLNSMCIPCANEVVNNKQARPVTWPCKIIESDFEQDTITLKMQNKDYFVSGGTFWLSMSKQNPAPAVAQGVPIGYIDTERLEVSGMTWATKEKTRDVHVPIFLGPAPAVAVNEQMLEALKAAQYRFKQYGYQAMQKTIEKVDDAIAAAEAAKKGGAA